MLAGIAMLGACAGALPGPPRPVGAAGARSLTRQEISAEIHRICALPASEREAELQRIKSQYGVVLYCGTE